MNIIENVRHVAGKVGEKISGIFEKTNLASRIFLIIDHRGIIKFPFPVDKNCRGQLCFITATSHQPVAGHHPANQETVFLKALSAVFGA